MFVVLKNKNVKRNHMKKLVIVLNLVCMFALGSFAQSMYGDAAKADVKMKYVYSFEEALKRAKEEHKLIFFNCFFVKVWFLPKPPGPQLHSPVRFRNSR